MPLNISRGLCQQVEDRKHALVRWATETGKLEDSSYLNKVDFLNNLIRTFGGDPNETEPSKVDIEASRAVSNPVKGFIKK